MVFTLVRLEKNSKYASIGLIYSFKESFSNWVYLDSSSSGTCYRCVLLVSFINFVYFSTNLGCQAIVGVFVW